MSDRTLLSSLRPQTRTSRPQQSLPSLHLLFLLLLLLLVACGHSLPMVGGGDSRNQSPTKAQVYFPRDRRLPSRSQWRNRMPSEAASVVFPSSVTTTTDLPTTEADIEASDTSSREYRERILIPVLDGKGLPNCTTSKEATYCEDSQEYPRLDLEQEIRMSKDQFRELFGLSVIDSRKSYSDDESSEVRVCRRTEKLIFPKVAKNQMNQWVYIVNNADYSQAVVSELCEKEDHPCDYMEDHSAFSSRCRQKYSYKKLMAVHPTEKKTVMDTFRFPSCCACYINVPLGLQTRKRRL